jgi:hypothetical protein
MPQIFCLLCVFAEAAAFFAQNFKTNTGPKAPSPFSVLVSAAVKGPDQKIFRHHDSNLSAEDVILLFDLLAGECRSNLIALAQNVLFACIDRFELLRVSVTTGLMPQFRAMSWP